MSLFMFICARTVRHHLIPETGECFLILSDLAELLGLRSRQELLALIQAGGLEVIDRMETPAVHRRGRSSLNCFNGIMSFSPWRYVTAFVYAVRTVISFHSYCSVGHVRPRARGEKQGGYQPLAPQTSYD